MGRSPALYPPLYFIFNEARCQIIFNFLCNNNIPTKYWAQIAGGCDDLVSPDRHITSILGSSNAQICIAIIKNNQLLPKNVMQFLENMDSCINESK